MRIQILELPMEHMGECSRTPFVVVFSELGSQEGVEKVLKAWNDGKTEDGQKPWGAAGCYATTEEVEL